MGQTYNWNFDDEDSYNTSGNKNPFHIFEESGVYDITLTVTDTNGCINVDVIEDLITVYPKPLAKFEPDPEIATVIKPVIYFNNLSIGAVDYHWFFGDGDSSLAENPKHIYVPNEQTYIVELRAESDKGCKDTVFLEVRIKDEYTFYAPTAFSPDDDNINDEFFIVGHGIDERNFKLIIYNRWGEAIFETDDTNAKWNGKSGNNECQLGTYTWLCIFKDIAGVEHAETGAVTIIR
jgi:gliding motility-associated-like protein